HAQTVSQWCDSITSICFGRFYISNLDTAHGYIFPPLPSSGGTPSNEFIGFFTAPLSTGWVGMSLGGGMTSNPLLVGWTDGNTPRVSVRYVTDYQPPQPLSGPKVTILGSSGRNSTHQRIFYRCQNCTVWSGGTGGINLSGSHVFGYALHGSLQPIEPSNVNSEIYQHTTFGLYGLDVSNWHSSNYNTILQTLTNAPPISGSPTSTTSSVPSPTSTVVTCPGAPNPVYTMVPASGWRVMPVLGRLSSPRGITLDSRGNLIVVQRGLGVTGHTLNSDGCVTSTKTIISDTSLNHAVEFNPSGNKLFASSSDIAWSWDYDASSMTATNKKTLITGMYNAGHNTRTLLVSKKYPNLLMASVGSNGNIDLPSFTPASGRAQVRVFDWTTLGSSGVPYTQGRVMGYGLRNDVGLVEDGGGIVHSVENSMDDGYRTINGVKRDVHNDNPAEKVYRLGSPNSPANLFGGYPYCFSVWLPSSFVDKTFTAGDWFVQAPNSTLTDAWCQANAVKPSLLLPPHTAPLDMKFGVGNDKTNLYVGLHGSWNRSPPQGYKVVVVPGRVDSSGAWSPSASLASSPSAFTDLLRNRDESQCTSVLILWSSGCFRPVGLVWSTNGENLYISSDTSGEVFLMKRGSGSGGGGGGGGSTTTPTPTTTPRPTTTTTTAGPTQTVWGQCAGIGYSGPKTCASGTTCKYVSDWY
ncbi:hypothetical protein BJ165DRAFT_1333787, partial [Panaeolus papilionaceus]